MAPYFGGGGLIINGQGTNSLTLSGPGVSYAAGVAEFAGVVVSQGGLTITSPNEIEIAGSLTLSEGATPPSIVQSKYLINQGPGTISFNSAPSVGNLLVLVCAGEFGIGVAGWTLQTGYGTGVPQNNQIFTKVAASTSPDVVFTCANATNQIAIYEVSGGMFGALTSSSGVASVSGVTVTTPAISTQANDLMLATFADVNNYNSSYLTPTPSGAVIDGQTNSQQFTACAMHYVAGASSEVLGVTEVAGPSGTIYSWLNIPFNSGNVSAIITGS